VGPEPVSVIVTTAETESALSVSPVAKSCTTKPETLASTAQFGVEMVWLQV
jgi:hypothetical protein